VFVDTVDNEEKVNSGLISLLLSMNEWYLTSCTLIFVYLDTSTNPNLDLVPQFSKMVNILGTAGKCMECVSSAFWLK
jgi:hypothetical protein